MLVDAFMLKKCMIKYCMRYNGTMCQGGNEILKGCSAFHVYLLNLTV